ncbi:MAG: hypothetical protein ACT4PL_02385 [Phycisphaerales bacterium]
MSARDFINDEPAEPSMLSPADQLALDALVAAGYRSTDLPGDVEARAAQIDRLLALLQPPASVPEVREALIQKTCRLVAVARDAAQVDQLSAAGATSEPTGWIDDDSGLLPIDSDALEALVVAGYDPARVPGSLRARASRQRALLELLTSGPALSEGARDGLISATLSRVQRGVEDQTQRLRFDPALAAPAPRAWRFTDLVSVAAVLLIGAAVVWPMATSMRERARQAACLGNFGSVKTAFGLYGGDNRDSLPMATASLAGLPWWNVGTPAESNTANMFHLAKSGYTTLEPLSCPSSGCCDKGAPAADQQDFRCIADVSYSMQNLFARERPRWSRGSVVAVLADRSPITIASLSKRSADPMSNSPNHEGRGQNVLFNDGTARWVESPRLACGDNIFLPRPIELKFVGLGRDPAGNPVVILQGVEQPSCAEDSFLGP